MSVIRLRPHDQAQVRGRRAEQRTGQPEGEGQGAVAADTQQQSTVARPTEQHHRERVLGFQFGPINQTCCVLYVERNREASPGAACENLQLVISSRCDCGHSQRQAW